MLLFHAKSHIGRPCFITPPPPTPTRVCGLFSSKPKLIFLPERRLFVFDFTYDATLSKGGFSGDLDPYHHNINIRNQSVLYKPAAGC